MFEDLEEENVDVNADSPDRAIAWAIASRGEAGTVTPEEGWAILHERYPDDPRFLLLNTYAEINEAKKQAVDTKSAAQVLTAAYLLKKIDRVMAADPTGAHEPHVRELVVFGTTELGAAKGEELTTVKSLRDKLGIEGESKRDDRDRAGLKLRRFEREVLKEVDDRTQDNPSAWRRCSSRRSPPTTGPPPRPTRASRAASMRPTRASRRASSSSTRNSEWASSPAPSRARPSSSSRAACGSSSPAPELGRKVYVTAAARPG